MKHKRFILGLLLLSFLLISMIYSYQNHQSNDPQTKKYTQFFEHTQTYNNTELSFKAEVLSIDNTNHTLRVFIQEKPYTYPQVILDMGDLDIQSLQKGDLLDVIATTHRTHPLTVTKLWVDEPWQDMLIILRSLPAIPFVLYLFFRTWRFDTSTWRFERRKKHA